MSPYRSAPARSGPSPRTTSSHRLLLAWLRGTIRRIERRRAEHAAMVGISDPRERYEIRRTAARYGPDAIEAIDTCRHNIMVYPAELAAHREALQRGDRSVVPVPLPMPPTKISK